MSVVGRLAAGPAVEQPSAAFVVGRLAAGSAVGRLAAVPVVGQLPAVAAAGRSAASGVAAGWDVCAPVVGHWPALVPALRVPVVVGVPAVGVASPLAPWSPSGSSAGCGGLAPVWADGPSVPVDSPVQPSRARATRAHMPPTDEGRPVAPPCPRR